MLDDDDFAHFVKKIYIILLYMVKVEPVQHQACIWRGVFNEYATFQLQDTASTDICVVCVNLLCD